jgi:hypothetical protein
VQGGKKRDEKENYSNITSNGHIDFIIPTMQQSSISRIKISWT